MLGISTTSNSANNHGGALRVDGKHLLPVAAFPQLFYAPATASTAAVTASEAFAEMAALRVTGISVHASKLLRLVDALPPSSCPLCGDELMNRCCQHSVQTQRR